MHWLTIAFCPWIDRTEIQTPDRSIDVLETCPTNLSNRWRIRFILVTSRHQPVMISANMSPGRIPAGVIVSHFFHLEVEIRF